MATRTKYRTKQKEALMQFMEAHQGQALSAQDIAESLHASGQRCSLTTAYRHLESLVASGVLKKIYSSSLNESLYSLVQSEEEKVSLHCSQCGKVSTLCDGQTRVLLEHLNRAHHFQVDLNQTFLVGHCTDCESESI